MSEGFESKIPKGATPKRFLDWHLDGKGKVRGRFPLAKGLEPDNYVELFEQGGKVIAIREVLEGEELPIGRLLTLDKAGRLQISNRSGPHPDLRLQNSYKYDGQGNLTERQEKDLDTGALRFRTTSKVSPAGQIAENAWYTGDGKLKERVTYAHDKGGRCIKETHYAGESGGKKVSGYFTFAYDAAGHETQRVWHNAEGTAMNTTVSEYGGDHDLPIKLTMTAASGVMSVLVLSYGPTGKKTGVELQGQEGEPLYEKSIHPVAGEKHESHREVPAASGDGGGGMLGRGDPSELHQQALIALAYEHFKNERYAAAMPLFKRAVSVDTADLYILNAIGACALKLGHFETAVRWYEKVLAKDPEHAQSKLGMESAKKAIGML